MGRRCVRYTKEELIGKLMEQCPDVMAKLPSPDSFSFNSCANDTHSLRIGSTGEGGRRSLRVICGGTTKPELYFKDDNGAFENFRDYRKLQGNSFFGRMTKSGLFYLFCDEVTAMVAFVFVYCGKQEEFVDFGFGKGFEILVEGLRYMMARDQDGTVLSDDTEDAGTDSVEVSDTDTVKIPVDDHSEQTQSNDHFQQSSVKTSSEMLTKRSLSVETDEHLAAKKPRVD